MFLLGNRFVEVLLLLSVAAAAACAHSSQSGSSNDHPKPATTSGKEDRVPGEYLVSVQKGGDEALVRRVFASYSVRDVRLVSDDLFLLKIEHDPGPDVIMRNAAESERIRSVQPNFVYRLDRPQGKIDAPVK